MLLSILHIKANPFRFIEHNFLYKSQKVVARTFLNNTLRDEVHGKIFDVDMTDCRF